MQGTILSNRYLIAEEIGAGGMGYVYRATDLRTGGEVAVKVPHTFLVRNPDFVERLRREAQIGASLYSPRVVRVMDLDVHEGLPYLVMEYVPGETLAEVLHQRGRLTVEETLAVCLEVARALDAAHAKGIVHRDLKPQNIKIIEGEVKVLDFGIAKREGSAGLTAADTFMGTPEYAAPERAEGMGDIRSDIYSLGVMLYQMLVGELPFSGPTPLAVMRQHKEAALPALSPDLPPWASEIVGRCLAKQPEDRYQTPRELVQALRVVLEAPSTGASSLSPSGGVAPTLGQSAVGQGGSLVATVAAPPSPPTGGDRTAMRSAAALPAGTAPAAPRQRRGIILLALVPAVVIVLGAALALVLTNRGGDGDSDANATSNSGTAVAIDESPPPTARGSATAPPTLSPPPPLLAVGQQRSLADLPPIALPVGDECPGVQVVWRLQSIAAEASGRVTVSYTVQAPRVNGIPDCRVGFNADKDCRCWVLQTRLVSGQVDEKVISGGRDAAETGAGDIYGRDPLPGTWIFDDVNLAGTELTLLFFVDGGVLYHRQLLHKN
ncbi:MAG: protein kinase domain-containing protein [Dehalococcoidia bacterium]